MDRDLRDGCLHHGARVDLNAAVVAGGVLATLAYSLLGRGIGVPAAGRVSDALVKRGVPRMTLVFVWLTIIIVLFQLLSMQVTTIWLVALIACVMSIAVNSFPLITVLVSETYGSEKTASVFGFINTLGQIAGATVLAASGYLGIALNTGARNSLEEYQGIWLAGMSSVAITTLIGAAMFVAPGTRTFRALRRWRHQCLDLPPEGGNTSSFVFM